MTERIPRHTIGYFSGPWSTVHGDTQDLVAPRASPKPNVLTSGNALPGGWEHVQEDRA